MILSEKGRKGQFSPSLRTLEKAGTFHTKVYDTKCKEIGMSGVFGKHGGIYYKDIKCLQASIKSAQMIESFLSSTTNFLNVDKTTLYALIVEAILEHGFGLSMTKGHTYNKTVKEYAYQKLKADENLIMTTCENPFSLPTPRKRKRYTQPMSSNIDSSKVLNAVKKCRRNEDPRTHYKLVSLGLSENMTSEQKVMVEATQILKAQPRKPNRSHWKANFGFAPTIPVEVVLQDVSPLMQFVKNDIIVTENGVGGYNFVLITEDVLFSDYLEDRMVIGTLITHNEAQETVFTITEKEVAIKEDKLIRDHANNDIACFASEPDFAAGSVYASAKFLKSLIRKKLN